MLLGCLSMLLFISMLCILGSVYAVYKHLCSFGRERQLSGTSATRVYTPGSWRLPRCTYVLSLIFKVAVVV